LRMTEIWARALLHLATSGACPVDRRANPPSSIPATTAKKNIPVGAFVHRRFSVWGGCSAVVGHNPSCRDELILPFSRCRIWVTPGKPRDEQILSAFVDSGHHAVMASSFSPRMTIWQASSGSGQHRHAA